MIYFWKDGEMFTTLAKIPRYQTRDSITQTSLVGSECNQGDSQRPPCTGPKTRWTGNGQPPTEAEKPARQGTWKEAKLNYGSLGHNWDETS